MKALLKILITTFLTLLMISAPCYGAPKKKKETNATPQTSVEAKRQQQAAEKEIKQTENQLRENEAKVKKELAELGKLEGEITDTKGKISVLNGKLTELSTRIKGLEGNIAKNEKELERLRAEYLKAVKKMRVTRKNQSDLAFIFSSGSFNQAMRRMRYLKEFSDWKNKQTNEINSKIADLRNEKDALAKTREEQNNALTLQKTNEKKLENQHKQEEVLIAKLKANGEALESHLKKKQAEANKLNGLVSNLIAQEQRQAEEKRRQEEQKRQEALRKQQEEQRQREEQRIREEDQRRKDQEQLAERQQKKSEDIKKTPTPAKPEPQPKDEEDEPVLAVAKGRQRKKKEQNQTEPKTFESTKIEKGSNSDFAAARKRAPRSKNGEPVTPPVQEKKATSFQDMKGRLPNPVSGKFQITSRFGRQTLPDLPGVEYDNPGIDAEVSMGAAAQAVYNGKVSGVYLLPGYNTVVIVNHDGYYTVYGNIASASVKVGDTVKTGQTLGSIAADEDNPGHSSIHFEVWKNREKLNPQDWLR